MAGDPSNASLWADADVYVGPTTAEDPADVDTAFGSDWDLCGLLDPQAGFKSTREEEMTDLYAWGGLLVRKSRRQFKLTRSFTLLEDSEVTRELIWPGSTDDAIYVPRPGRIKIAFEVREGLVTERLISKYQAEVDITEDVLQTEADLTKYPMWSTIYPDPDSVSPTTGAPQLFVRQSSLGES